MTPYRSVYPIDSITPVDYLNPNILLQKRVYQSIVGCINGIFTWTCPDIDTSLTFIASHRNSAHQQHYKAALYVLRQLTSTNEDGIPFHSIFSSKIQALNNLPHHHNKEAHTNSIPPSPSEFHQLNAFCDAIWGGQFGSAVGDGTPLELFKFCPLSGFFICCPGSPTYWKSILQNKTPRALSKPRTWQQIKAQQNYSPWKIVPTTWEWRRLIIVRQYTTIIKYTYIGMLPLNKKVSNTLTSGETRFGNDISQNMSRWSIYLASSTTLTSSQGRRKGKNLLSKSLQFHDGFLPSLSQIPSQCSLSHYFCRDNPSLLLYLVRNNHSSITGTPVESHPDRIKIVFPSFLSTGGCWQNPSQQILTLAPVRPPPKIIVETKNTLTLFKNKLMSPPIGGGGRGMWRYQAGGRRFLLSSVPLSQFLR